MCLWHQHAGTVPTTFGFGYKMVELCARQEAGPWPSTLCFCLPWATRASSELTKGFRTRPRKGFEHGPGWCEDPEKPSLWKPLRQLTDDSIVLRYSLAMCSRWLL